MIDKNRYNEYLEVIRDKKDISLLSTVFFLILTSLVIGYTIIDTNTLNVVSMIFISGSFIISVCNLVINNIKLSTIKSNKNKYMNV